MRINLRTTILTGLAALGMAVVLPAIASAALTGVCSSCHTMHNSQGGTNVVGTLTNPNDNLLKNNCIGCHTDTGVNDGTGTPQVNASGSPLAGGFFAAAADDGNGHDVTGVNGSDATLGNNPPGGTIGGALSCDGANGCHSATGVHHTNTTGSYVATGYRFLTGATAVSGIEAANWEFSTTTTTHNVYGAVAGAAGINALCNICHDKFHGTAADESGPGSGAWIRHPTDVDVFSTGGEYDSYGAGSTGVGVYNVIAPVGSNNAGGAYDPLNLAAGDGIVLCVSCHRAHGSDQADMLRWSYSTISAGGASFTGCFICHTEKNQ